MSRIVAALAVVLLLVATPARAQQIACVPDTAAADEAARNAGEELAWEGVTNSGAPMRFYLGLYTWTAFFQYNGAWCTSPSMVGTIKKADSA